MKIITRAEAKKDNLPRYFTGLPCKHDHVAERSTANGQCLECARIRSRNTYNKDLGLSRKKAKEYRDQHPELSEKKQLRRYKKDPKLSARQQLKAEELRDREQAKKHGGSMYLSKRPCGRGHIGLRFTNDGKCVECNRIACQARHEKKVNSNPELLAIRNKRIEAQKERARRREIASQRNLVRAASGENRQQAMRKKAVTFEGSPCSVCGGTTRFTSSGQCFACAHTRSTCDAKKQYDKQYVKENYDWILDKQKRYRQLNSEVLVERARQWREKNPENENQYLSLTKPVGGQLRKMAIRQPSSTLGSSRP